MSRSHGDRLLVGTLVVLATVAGAIVLFIVAFVLLESIPALRHLGPLRFVTDRSWYPSEGLYDLVPMLAGTLLITAGAVLVATPLGIISAIFLHDYAPEVLRRPYRRLIELLAGIPSVVYGFWGLVVLVPLIGAIGPPGTSLLAGILVLSLMILPTITLIADAAISGVPREYVQAAAALGLTRWGTLRRVVLPAARPGLLSGIFLATARALGETMAVLMVCGNVVQVPRGLFEPVRVLTANIALEMAYAMGDHRSALFVSGLALIVMVAALVLAAEMAGRRRVGV